MWCAVTSRYSQILLSVLLLLLLIYMPCEESKCMVSVVNLPHVLYIRDHQGRSRMSLKLT